MEILVSSGSLSIARVARELGMSRRTLQRRLRAESLTFRKLQARARFHLACSLLLHTDLSVQEVARRLGYRRPGAFARAFQRWSGRSPRAFRLAARDQKLAQNG